MILEQMIVVTTPTIMIMRKILVVVANTITRKVLVIVTAIVMVAFTIMAVKISNADNNNDREMVLEIVPLAVLLTYFKSGSNSI